MYMDAYRIFRQHIQAPHGQVRVVSAKNNYQISGKYQKLGTLSALERGWCATKRHIHCHSRHSKPTLDVYGWLEVLLQHIQAPYGQAWIISAKNYSQTSGKISYFGHPFSTGNGMLCCSEIHPLLVKHFKTFLRWMRTIKYASDSIQEPSWCT